MTPQTTPPPCPHCGAPVGSHDAVCLTCGQVLLRTAPARPSAPPQSLDYIKGIDAPPPPDPRAPSDDPKRLALALTFLGCAGLLALWWLVASGTLAALFRSPKLLAGIGVVVALAVIWTWVQRNREKALVERLRRARTADAKLAALDDEIEANRRRADMLRNLRGQDGPL